MSRYVRACKQRSHMPVCTDKHWSTGGTAACGSVEMNTI